MAQRGSMTSVTQEDSSIDSESDTTESSYSNIISSVLSSTDTDDKLTPSLGEISISVSKKEKQVKSEDLNDKVRNRKFESLNENKFCHGLKSRDSSEYCQTGFVQHSRGCHSSLRRAFKKRRKNGNLLHYLLNRPQSNLNINNNASCLENLGVDDLENKLSTDFSDTSSIAVAENSKGPMTLSGSLEQETEVRIESHMESSSNTEQTENDETGESSWDWEPDMSSVHWYQAGCFDRYWHHYGFVMAWYRAHMDAVQRLHSDFARSYMACRSRGRGRSNNVSNGQRTQTSGLARGFSRSNKMKHSRRVKRARSRRNAKAKQRADKTKQTVTTKVAGGHLGSGNDSGTARTEEQQEEETDVQMEITDDMLDFFKTTLQHRKERDEVKNGNTKDGASATEARINIEDATAGQFGPSTAPPVERPGARRAEEMKQLYGEGAAMIHGMETALQMTFDRTKDKHQPKLWPNMPLKIVFG